MTVFANAALFFGTIIAMEFVAKYSHKYIMHGWGWGWHASHHNDHTDTFERNDLYAVVFALPSFLLVLAGSIYDNPILWIGAGMTAYGFLYFVVHDGLVHNRWPFRVVPKNAYLKRLVQAHRMHHAVHGRDGCVSFGFVIAPDISKLKQELRDLHGGKFDADAATHHGSRSGVKMAERVSTKAPAEVGQ